MIPQSDHSSNDMPNVRTVFAYQREHLETYQANLHAADPGEYQNYTLREVLEFISDFDELARHASDIDVILDRSSNLNPIERLSFQNELRRMCDVSQGLTADLNHIADQICEGKKNIKTFKKIEPNILLLRRLIDRTVRRLDLIINREIAFD
jgi:hypothetical protein